MIPQTWIQTSTITTKKASDYTLNLFAPYTHLMPSRMTTSFRNFVTLDIFLSIALLEVTIEETWANTQNINAMALTTTNNPEYKTVFESVHNKLVMCAHFYKMLLIGKWKHSKLNIYMVEVSYNFYIDKY